MCLFVGCLCVCMCQYMCFVLANESFVSLYMYLEFHTCIDCWHTVWFLPTVCHQFFFCCHLFADALLCILCFVCIILSVTLIEYILINWVPI